MNSIIRTGLNISLLVLASAFAPVKLSGQNAGIVLPAAKVTLSELIESVEKQTQYLFAYDPAVVDAKKTIVFDSRTISVEKTLPVIERYTDYSLNIINRYILIDPRPRTTKTIENNRFAPIAGEVYKPNRAQEIDLQPNPRPVVAQDSEPAVETIETPMDSLPPAPLFHTDTISVSAFSNIHAKLAKINLKIDLLYVAATLTPNLSFEIGVAPRHSLELSVSYNPWRYKASLKNNDKLLHLLVRPEYRYWLCERYNGHFIGAHLFYGRYNVSGHTVPMLFKKDYRYHGYSIGAGFVYGYHLPIAKRWNIEFSAGVGAAYMNYDRYGCTLCNKNAEPESRVYLGPTRASVGLVYLIK